MVCDDINSALSILIYTKISHRHNAKSKRTNYMHRLLISHSPIQYSSIIYNFLCILMKYTYSE